MSDLGTLRDQVEDLILEHGRLLAERNELFAEIQTLRNARDEWRRIATGLAGCVGGDEAVKHLSYYESAVRNEKM